METSPLICTANDNGLYNNDNGLRHERVKVQWKNTFILWKIDTPFLRCLIFYILNHFINLESSDVMMGSSTRYRVNFWIYLWIINRVVMKLDQLIKIMDNIFRKFCMIWTAGAKSSFFLIFQPTAIQEKPIVIG